MEKEPVTLTVNLTEAIADLQLGICDEQIEVIAKDIKRGWDFSHCLLYTSPSPRDLSTSRMPSSA